jgi:tRNA-specific 2-thiouridylase
MPATRDKVVVAMSGGVDSSVAAALLLRQGYDVVGCFMRLGSPKGVESDSESDSCGPASASPECSTTTPGKNKQGCCSVLDAADARRVAGILDVPFYVLNFEDDFGRVIDYFVDEYNRGRTPNPCVRCNDWLKFGKLAKYAEAVGARYVASGHYARVGVDPATGEKALLRGLDHRKDQSYVLFGMSRENLEHTMLPIGEFEKHDVRAIAEEMKLPVFNKPGQPGDLLRARTRITRGWCGGVRRRRSARAKSSRRMGRSSRNTKATSISRSASERASA